MIKRILLGFLLVPCLSNAMEELRVSKQDNGAGSIQYLRGYVSVVRKETLAGYVYSLRLGGPLVITGETAFKEFNKLEEVYERQDRQQ